MPLAEATPELGARGFFGKDAAGLSGQMNREDVFWGLFIGCGIGKPALWVAHTVGHVEPVLGFLGAACGRPKPSESEVRARTGTSESTPSAENAKKARRANSALAGASCALVGRRWCLVSDSATWNPGKSEREPARRLPNSEMKSVMKVSQSLFQDRKTVHVNLRLDVTTPV